MPNASPSKKSRRPEPDNVRHTEADTASEAPTEDMPANPASVSQDAVTEPQVDRLDVPAPESLTSEAGAIPGDASHSPETEDLSETAQTDPSEELLSLREWTYQVESLNADIIELTDEHEEDKKKAKASKTRLESAQADLNMFIAKGQEKHPLFDKSKPSESPTPRPEPAADSEAWRTVSVWALDLTLVVVTKLSHAGIETMGDLADWSALKGKRTEDIPGIGEATAAKIDAATEAYWAESRKALVIPQAEIPADKPKRTRKKKGEAESIEGGAVETPTIADRLDAQTAAAELLEGVDIATGIVITHQGEIDVEESDLASFDEDDDANFEADDATDLNGFPHPDADDATDSTRQNDPLQMRACFVCDGTKEKCDGCGETQVNCGCEEEGGMFRPGPCPDCEGTGVASADRDRSMATD